MDPFHYAPSRLRVSKKTSDQFFLVKNQVLCSKNQDLSSDHSSIQPDSGDNSFCIENAVRARYTIPIEPFTLIRRSHEVSYRIVVLERLFSAIPLQNQAI